MGWQHELDRAGEIVLVYEGIGLLLHHIPRTWCKGMPLVSDVVWMLRGTKLGWVLPSGVLAWLAFHFWTGGPERVREAVQELLEEAALTTLVETVTMLTAKDDGLRQDVAE